MAKKESKEESNDTKVSPLDLVRAALKNRFKDKKNVVKKASTFREEKKVVVHVSPSLDIALGGGIQEGTWTILSGNPKVGKTALSLQIAAHAQKLGKYVYYLAVEGRLKSRDMDGIHGLNPDQMEVICSAENEVLEAEDYLNSAMDIIKNHPGCVLIIDSASALCSASEFSKELTANTRADGPKLLASFCRQMCGIVPAQKTIVIIIQHLIANTSGYGPTYMEDGGRKILYQVDTKLRPKKVEKWEDGDKQIGNIITWEVVTSALSGPGIASPSYFRFGHGLDEEMELITVALDLGLISQAGAWYKLDWLLEDFEKMASFLGLTHITNENITQEQKEELTKHVKFQGQEKTRLYLTENEFVKEDLFKRVSQLMAS